MGDVFCLSSVLSIVSCVVRSMWRIVVAEVSVWRTVESPEVIPYSPILNRWVQYICWGANWHKLSSD